MAPVVLWTFLALIAAVVVMVAAGAAERSGGLRQFATDLRGGLRRRPRHEGPGLLAMARQDEAQDRQDDASVAELFTIGPSERNAYLTAEDLLAPVSRARTRATGGRTAVADPTGPAHDRPTTSPGRP